MTAAARRGDGTRLQPGRATSEDGAMINYRAALLVLAAVALSACAAPSAASVPPGCDLSAAPPRWSQPTKEPRLTRVTVYRIESADPGAGRTVLDQPFAPAITRLAAPDDWTARLAESLSAKTGDKIQTEPARLKDGGYGLSVGGQDDPDITETLSYEGVEAVSADFSVDCERTVSGTFTSWTTVSFGGVTCAAADEPAEPLGRLARRYCPRTPAPLPSTIDDAIPFDGVPTAY
jgi:hypothetical protein